MTRRSRSPSTQAERTKVLVIYSVADTAGATTMEYVRSLGKSSCNSILDISGTARLAVELHS